MGRVMMMQRTVAATRGMASVRAVGVLIIAGAAMGATAFLAQRALAQTSGATAEASAATAR